MSASSSTSVQLNTAAGMQYVRLGKSGLKVSRIAFGCMSFGDPSRWMKWVLDESAARPFIVRALERGINFFDTADTYSSGESERILGSIIKSLGTRRSDLVIATKVFFPTDVVTGDQLERHFPVADAAPNRCGLSRKHIFDAIDASLERLQMEYVDLYQIHRWDKDTSVEEVMCALNDLVRSGKVRYIGASSMPAWQFQLCQNVAEKNGWTKFITMQNHYNLVYREEEREMIPYCSFSGVGLIPWSPLARGFLTGRRETTKVASMKEEATLRAQTDKLMDDRYNLPSDHAVVTAVMAVAAQQGVKPAQVSLAWLLRQSAVAAPIVGATKMYQLDEAVDAINVNLTPEEIASLQEPYEPHAQMDM